MRKRALVMALKAVAVAVTILGVPLALIAPSFVYHSYTNEAHSEAEAIGRLIDRNEAHPASTTGIIRSWMGNEERSKYIRVVTEEGLVYSAGSRPDTPYITATTQSARGVKILIELDAWPALWNILLVLVLIVLGCLSAGVGAWIIAQRESRRLAAPLIYLAAQAEQIGTGMVQPRVAPSGIEEIDLVQEELVRSNKQLAGRIAKERQFASDASHQLRTPLTALSMRLEEIQMIADDDDVRHEAEECLDQVERLTDIVEALLKASRQRDRRNTEAIALEDVFNQQREEWADHFAEAGRTLEFSDPDNRIVVATPGSLSQALATLIENSLKYGAGTVRVQAKPGASKQSVVIEVSDEGEGIEEDHASQVFTRGFSTHNSTGIGLALAKSLVETDGGWIRLQQNSPPVFAIGLTTVKDSMNPKKVIPAGGIVNVGRRNRVM